MVCCSFCFCRLFCWKPLWSLVGVTSLVVGATASASASLTETDAFSPADPSPSAADGPQGESPASEDGAHSTDHTLLQLTQSELRDQRPRAIAGGMGRRSAWEDYHARALFFWSDRVSVAASLGWGSTTFDSLGRGERTFGLEVRSRSFDATAEYRLNEDLPVHLAVGLGARSWSGHYQPRARDVGATADQALAGGFSALGGAVTVGIGVRYLWAGGLMLDGVVVGRSLGWVNDLAASHADPERARDIRHVLSSGQIWGVTNISVGYCW